MPDPTGKKQGSEGTRGTGRTAAGQFTPGTSGNPRGRPKGSRDKRTLLLGELLDGGGEAIMEKFVKLAKSGKPWAVRIAIDRLLPRHERRVELELPRIEKADDVAGAVATVIECAAQGSLSIEEARAFLLLIEQQRKAIETQDLAVRLELLEREQQSEGEESDSIDRRYGFRKEHE